MKRRLFLLFSSVLGVSTCVKAKRTTPFEEAFMKVEPTIRHVQEHLFPEGSKLPSARSMDVTKFMFETMKHESFDKDIQKFVLDGAKELMKREKNFTSLSGHEKEKVLRDFEKTRYGSNWLSRIITLTMEAMFSDPVYGSNINEAGWKALNAFGGYPRPERRYVDL